MEIRLFKQVAGDILIGDLGYLLLTDENTPATGGTSSGLTLTGVDGMFTIMEVMKSVELQQLINDGDVIITDENGIFILDLSTIEPYSKFEANLTFVSGNELTGYTTKTDFNSHIGDTTIHFTKDSINLDDLGNVNTAGVQEGYFLMFANGTWIPNSAVTDLSNYYTKYESDVNFLSATTTITDLGGFTSGETINNFLSANTSFYTQNEANVNFLSATTTVSDLGGFTSGEIINNFLSASTTISDLGGFTSGETINNFLTASTFESQVTFNINTTGNITAVTFDGNLDWDYITNDPGFTLRSDFNDHTGATNPHATSFNDLTSTAHTHLWSDLTTTAHTHVKSEITDFTESDYVHTTGDENIAGNKTFDNSVIISGNLFVAGTATTFYSEDLSVKDNLITINSGETGSGVTRGEAGIVIDRGASTDYVFFFDEPTDTFRVGESGNTQAVVTREDTPSNSGIAFWNASQYRFNTSNNLVWNGLGLNINGTISASTIYADIVGNIDWYSVTNTPTTLDGYGITDAYTTAQTIANFLSANTFDTTINTNGINNAGGITATTLYGNLDWSYITNEPTFALYSDLTAHTSLTGSSNPHQIAFDDLTSTAHTHIWGDITNTPTTIAGYGITNAYTITEADAKFVYKTGDTMTGTLTVPILTATTVSATTLEGDLVWDYIQNVPDFALETELTAHTSLTGASNPHQIAFNDLTLTSHTHDERYYTKNESDGLYYSISGGTVYGDVSIDGSLDLASGVTIFGISDATGLTENSNSYLSTQAAIKAYIASQTMITYDAARSGNVNAPVDLLRNGIATSKTPYVVPKNMKILAMSISTSASNTWSGTTLVNNAVVATVAAAAENKVYSLFNINVNAGDEIRLRVNDNTGQVNNPAITIYMTER